MHNNYHPDYAIELTRLKYVEKERVALNTHYITVVAKTAMGSGLRPGFASSARTCLLLMFVARASQVAYTTLAHYYASDIAFLSAQSLDRKDIDMRFKSKIEDVYVPFRGKHILMKQKSLSLLGKLEKGICHMMNFSTILVLMFFTVVISPITYLIGYIWGKAELKKEEIVQSTHDAQS